MSYELLISSIAEVHASTQAGAAGAVNRYLTLRNWFIGAYIVEFEQNGEDRASYGQQQLPRLARDLKRRKIPGCSPERLGRMRFFYRTYPQLSESVAQPFATESGTFRAPANPTEIPSPPVTESSTVSKARIQISELIRDPHVLEFVGLAERHRYTESDLETALLDDIQAFLLELGGGFCFEARQKRITVGNQHDYIDLVFYHRLLRCHLLIDLKVRHFQHSDAGQMNFYLNYWKREVRTPEDNPPVGLLLCSDKDQTKVEYAIGGLGQQLFVSRYLVALPKPNEIEQLIARDRALWEQRGGKNRPPSHDPPKGN
jgi:hypothetical protein